MTQTTANHPTCPVCGRPLPVVGRRTSFCPHCGGRIHRRRPVVKAVVVAAGVLVLGGAWLSVVHRHAPAFDTTGVVSHASDPLDGVLAETQAVRLARADDLDRRGAEVRSLRQGLVDQVGNLTNLSARISTAVARANDENHWPAVVAGRPLQRADADAVVERIATVLKVERPAIEHDDHVLAQLAAAARAVRASAAEVGQLRGELAAHPSDERRAQINRRAGVYRSDDSRLPDGAGWVADPVRPVDADALLR